MSFTGVDETRTCRDCQQSFIFTAGEQNWLMERVTDPKPPNRCKPCRQANKQNRPSNNDGGRYNATGGYNSGSNYNNPTSTLPQSQSVVAKPLVEHKTFTEARPAGQEDEFRPRKDGKKRRRGRDDFDDDF